MTDEELVVAAKAALEGVAPITPNQWNDDYTAAGDTNIITVAQNIIDKVVSGVTVGDTVVSENTDRVAEDGTITYKTKKEFRSPLL